MDETRKFLGTASTFVDMLRYAINKEDIPTRQEIIDRMDFLKKFTMTQEEYDEVLVILNASEKYKE